LLAIFNAPDRAEAQRLLASTVTQWRADMPKLADWAEVNVPESFAVFEPPAAHRTRLRTTNGLERINRELKRRTRVGPPVSQRRVLPAAGLGPADRVRRGESFPI
jgi:transposase-like protein